MREEQHEILDSKITLHDKHRFEIKLDVELPPGRKNIYKVETYFFVPRALNIGPNTYSKSDFYNSSQKYIRFKTPQMTLGKLADPEVKISPLSRVNKGLSMLLSGSKDPGVADTIYSEIKLLGCVARGAVRDYVKYILSDILSICSSSSAREAMVSRVKSVEENGLGFIRDVRGLISRVRALRGEMSSPVVPARLRDCFGFFDEFFSLTIEDYLTVLLEGVRKNEDLRKELKALEESLVDVITAQGLYRRSMGYPSVIKPGTENEEIVYRRSVLKKFISSALYLQIVISEWEGWMQLFFGLAAGIAMLFAAAIMVYAQNRYATNSMSFVVVVVVSYIFKDRIKDWLKLLFSKGMTRWIADRKVSVQDPRNGQTIGSFKEAFSFLKSGAVPSDIAHRRNIDNITSIDEEGKPERVFKYEKEVTLYTWKIFKAHERRKDLNDIMRFSVEDFLVQADDPKVDYLHLDAGSRGLESIQCSRVYHVNMLIKYISFDSAGKERFGYERVRIVLNREGIVRLEEVHVA